MENLRYYDKLRHVPSEAKKTISAGRLKGMTDINPMWRIKALTETFGPCGIGWYPEIVDTWLETGANGEISANMKILLYVKEGDEWSKGIPGVGGSKFVAKESAGLYTDDEAYKKAFTDAISVAAKLLGVAADVYFEKDTTKYDGNGAQTAKSPAGAAKASATNRETGKGQKAAQSPEDELAQARKTEVVIRGTAYKLGDLPVGTVEWLAQHSQTEEVKAAANLIVKDAFKNAMQEDDVIPWEDKDVKGQDS